jgi:hypothetical protein
VRSRLWDLWNDDTGLDLAEFVLAFAVVFALMLGLKVVGFSSHHAFSAVGDKLDDMAR